MRTTRSARWSLPGLALALILLPAAAGAQAAADVPDLPDHPTLEDFIRVAEARSPGLEASRRLWRAQAEDADAAGSFPDPQVSFAWYAQEVETRVGPQKQRLSVRQRLPWFGKLALAEDVADQGVRAAHARHDERRLVLRRDVTLAWLDLYWLDRATALSRENLDLLTDLERVIRERYRIGRAGHADLIRVQVELGTVENMLASLEDRVRPAAARLNALLHRPENAPLPTPTALPEVPVAPPADEVRAAVRGGSLRLRESEWRVAQAQASSRLAQRSRWPDWMVAADWIRTDDSLDPAMDESGKDALVVSVSVDVPLFRGKWDGPARGAQERLAAAEANRSLEENELIARAEEILFDWRDADRRVNLYGAGLLPKAHESYAALDTAYRTGEGAFLDLIDAERTLLDFQLEWERARTDRARSSAKLRQLTGEYEGREGPR
ncbi:TolC family protein [bacterium]|nr:TolC family protein [bacterium]